MYDQTLNLFKAIVLDDNQTKTMFFDDAQKGYVTDFVPTASQRVALQAAFKPLPVTTLFSVEERRNASLDHLLSKQILHYIEVYGLNRPGLFDLETTNGTAFAMMFVAGVTKFELGEMVRELLYANAPIKDANELKGIIDTYGVKVDINLVANNEMRCLLFDAVNDTFESGDDAVRWMCFKATNQPMLIKSKEVIEAVKKMDAIAPRFFERHATQLAQVFNRHKPLILAAKNAFNATIINKIGRMSKTQHIPINEPISKTFVSKALSGELTNVRGVLDTIKLRDKFKFLNLLEYKKLQQTTEAFVIRNGKVHLESGRQTFDKSRINGLIGTIVASIREDLNGLRGKNILLDPRVDYGLPVSRKQAVGQLPFGTLVSVDGDRISSGVYWENDWGGRDLDLSAINSDGERTGWGGYSGYDRSNPIEFSGDVTSAPNGAMEFLTSSVNHNVGYGLLVNIYSGERGAGYELVVGDQSSDRWIDNTIIREKSRLDSRQNIVGFVRDGKFVVWQGRFGNGRISNAPTAMIARGLAEFWTIEQLLRACDINFDTERKSDVDYDIDLSYAGFTFDKLEKVFNI